MNVSDAEAVAGMLSEHGYEMADSELEADIVFLVTCSVRELAEQKVIGKLGQIVKRRKKNPDLIIGVLGCMAENWKEKLVEKLPYVDIVCGPKDLAKLPGMIESVRASRKAAIAVNGEEVSMDAHVPRVRSGSLSAWVPVMRGCNNFCSYCIVPYVRGREISRTSADVIEEIKKLVDTGYKEVILLGQNVNSYGLGLDEKIDFAGLLERIDAQTGIQRVKFVTSHPKDISDRLIDAVAGLDSVCEYFHFPVQSGSNRILKLMNRGYTRESYLEIAGRLRERVPDIALSSDFIVGYPTEVDEEFRETLDIVVKVGYEFSYAFKYSVRSGTKAANMLDDVPLAVKEARHAELIGLLDKISYKKNKEQVGKIKEVLVEGPSKRNPERMSGRGRDNRMVMFDKTEDVKPGDIVQVKIERATERTLFGKLET